MKESLLDFVKGRLEEGEGVSPDALARILSAARGESPAGRPLAGSRPWSAAKRALLLAASLALVCCGWLAYECASAHREADLTNVIALLRAAEGSQAAESPSLAESLLAWQDAPCLESVN